MPHEPCDREPVDLGRLVRRRRHAPAIGADLPAVVTPASPDPSPAYLELYRLAVEMADRVSARRTTANNFFLAVHATLATVVGLLGLGILGESPGSQSSAPDPSATIVVGVAGVLLSIAWWLGLRSYRDLNAAKFKVITKLEEQLPARIFTEEWLRLRRDEIPWWRGRYAEQGTVERVVPFIFAGLYVIAIWRSISG